jgi:hypothetical protein
MSQYVHTFICIKFFMIRLENLHKVVRIDNIRFASDHGMNHISSVDPIVDLWQLIISRNFN